MPRTRRRIDKRLGSFGFLSAAAIVGALGFAGCSSSDGGAAGDTCTSDKQFFAERIWSTTLAQKCVSCHNRGGQAKESGMVLLNSAEAGYLDQNFEIVKAAS